jgi:hypothetical protein
MMDRRAFIGTLAGGLLAAPLAAGAQPGAQAPRIGFLWGGTPPQSLLREFEDALRERGWERPRAVPSACRSLQPSWSRRGSASW